ncbi:ABC transporter ATP-binding protein [Eisenbergiella tayi]|uniref:ABC transporter ATP-binding protein n=1 Tax=Eisenbergiella tayi TaxID=1432052 RepID=UPI0032BF7C5E
MIGVLKKIWDFAGEEQGNIRRSMILGFFYAVFHMFQIAAIYVVVLALVGGSTDSAPAWQALGLLLASILGRAVLNRFSQLQQTHAGYFMVANKRISIGDKLKRVPMGYFNDQSLGELTGITTTVLDEVESTGPMVLVSILGGLINSAVMMLCVLFWDWRIGLLALAGMLVYLALLSGMEKQSAKIAPKRQRDEARLVEAVLEQLQGMSVIKSFNLTGKGDQRVRQALEDSRANNLAVEKLFTPYIWGQEMVLHLFSVLILAASVGLCLTGAMSLANALMAVIVSFLIFSQIQSAGSGVSALRLVGSSIDHANQVDDIPEMDQRGTAIRPESHEIVFDHVNFSYGSRPILKDVSLTIPDRTTTAIVGPSGSGKTTLCNLIARFWDVDGGRVTIGGRDVREYTLESLMEQVSMVFQRVYLFADTVENNIKFGCPGATHEQVVEAAKKACCHDFISALPDGYNTVIGEGGATLSGGEKQRISIARCLLKDAPIVIFDEATANVDPENEDQLQKAMEALTREKTVLMIAHRLKTVRGADQILVVDQGRIVQRGTHDELIQQMGIYRDFVSERTESSRWTL